MPTAHRIPAKTASVNVRIRRHKAGGEISEEELEFISQVGFRNGSWVALDDLMDVDRQAWRRPNRSGHDAINLSLELYGRMVAIGFSKLMNNHFGTAIYSVGCIKQELLNDPGRAKNLGPLSNANTR